MKDAHAIESLADRQFMECAIRELAKSSGDSPRVGAVVVLDGQVVARGHRSNEEHAERAAINAAIGAGIGLRGATIYTTLEPCVPLSASPEARESCAELIARVGISTVVIGRYDPNPRIFRRGWKALRDAGVNLRDFPPDLRDGIDELNSVFVSHFTIGVGPTGGAKFDYLLNDGDFEIQFSEADERRIVTRWTTAGVRAIYAYARPPLKVALAKYAEQFSEVDDPRAFDFSHSVRVEEGEIAVFVGVTAAALVKVIEVHSGPRYGSDHTSVKVQYEVRVFGESDL
jgi:diaminohydroxyphosphoribosylaminopyrimidine deaminase/5-amino-6-(5-phosphoribosylamino)uracil reductase